MQGLSLLPIMKGEKPTNRCAKKSHLWLIRNSGAHSSKNTEGAFDGRFKIIHFYDSDEWEFYDLQSDPKENELMSTQPQEMQTK